MVSPKATLGVHAREWPGTGMAAQGGGGVAIPGSAQELSG